MTPTTQSKRTRVLISTIYADGGGVPFKLRFLTELLVAEGFEVTLACYLPYRLFPYHSVPSWMLLSRAPRTKELDRADGLRMVGVGVRLPEFEWARGLPNKAWRALIASHDIHMTVSGSILPAYPFFASNTPFLSWIGTPYYPDKQERVRFYSPPRRLFDALLDTPICKRMERKILGASPVLAVSAYTKSALLAINPDADVTVMPIPVALPSGTQPADRTPGAGVILGFAGRLDDPRKNLSLLIDALAQVRQHSPEVRLRLAGGIIPDHVAQQITDLGLQDAVDLLGHLGADDLAHFYASLDIFVIPSAQEGLGIVGLEAMAHGCPVISTTCGGPQDYVRPAKTGLLVDFTPEKMAEAILSLVNDPAERNRLGQGARDCIAQDYNAKATANQFWRAFNARFMT